MVSEKSFAVRYSLKVVTTLTGFYNYLEGIMPIKRILISLAVGVVPLFIVLFSGLTSDFVRAETVASRTFSAFCFTALVSFIFLMSCEEYAIFKTKRELEHFVNDAQISQTDEDFDRAEYLGLNEQDTADDEYSVDDEEDTFQLMDFGGLSSRQ